jgi:hypothetical protein
MKKTLISIAIAAVISTPAMALNLTAVGGGAVSSAASASVVGTGASNQFAGADAANTTSVSGVESAGVAGITTSVVGSSASQVVGTVSGAGVGTSEANAIQGGLAFGDATSSISGIAVHPLGDVIVTTGGGQAEASSISGQGSGTFANNVGTGDAFQSAGAAATNVTTATISGNLGASHHNSLIEGTAVTSSVGSSSVAGLGVANGGAGGLTLVGSGSAGNADVGGSGSSVLSHANANPGAGSSSADVASHSDGFSVTAGAGINNFSGDAQQAHFANNTSTTLVDVTLPSHDGTTPAVVITNNATGGNASVAGAQVGAGSVIGGGLSGANSDGAATSNGVAGL